MCLIISDRPPPPRTLLDIGGLSTRFEVGRGDKVFFHAQYFRGYPEVDSTALEVVPAAPWFVTGTFSKGPAWIASPTAADLGIYTVTFSATNEGGTTRQEFTLVVAADNSDPVPWVAGRLPPDLTVARGETYEMHLLEWFRDPDADDEVLVLDSITADFDDDANYIMEGDPGYPTVMAGGNPAYDLKFSEWFRAMTNNLDSFLIHPGAKVKTGSRTVSYRVVDGSTDGDRRTFTVTVLADAPANTAPTRTSPLTAQTATHGMAFQYDVWPHFSDDGNGILAFTATLKGGADLPSWLALNRSVGVFSGTPPADFAGDLEIAVSVSDGRPGSAAATGEFTLSVLSPNQPPVITGSVTGGLAPVGRDYALDLSGLSFSDPDGDDILIAVDVTQADGTDRPAWLSLAQTPLGLSGRPAAADAGTLELKVIATDARGGTDELTFQVEVPVTALALAAEHHPYLDRIMVSVTQVAGMAATADVDFLVEASSTVLDLAVPGASGFGRNQSRRLTMPAASPDGTVFMTEFTVNRATTSGGPAGGDNPVTVALNPPTGQEDTFAISGADSVLVTVPNRPPGDFPVRETPLGDQPATVNMAFTFDFPADAFSDPEGMGLTYDANLADGSELPEWLMFIPADREFRGTPPATTSGQGISIEVWAIGPDGYGTSDIFDLVVAPVAGNAGPIASAPIPDQRLMEDDPFRLDASGTFTDPDSSDPMTWSVGTLPGWLSFAADTQVFSGVPTQAAARGGKVTITLMVVDSGGATNSDAFDITVTEVNDDPVHAGLPDRLVTVGDDWSHVATEFTDEEGDTLTYDATLADDSPLPMWLRFTAADRTFRGTPMVGDHAVHRVKMTAADGNGGSGSTVFTLTVNARPTVTQPFDAARVDEGTPWSITLSEHFEDADDSILTYRPTLAGGTLPDWLSLRGSNKDELGGTVPLGANAVLQINISASDGRGGVVVAPLTLTLVAGPPVYRLSGTVDRDTRQVTATLSLARGRTPATNVAGLTHVVTVTANGGYTIANPRLSFRMPADSPPGTTTVFSETTGYTPPADNEDAPGTITLRVEGATDDPSTTTVMVTGTHPVVIDVGTEAPNRSPLVRVPIPDQQVASGGRFDYTLSADTFNDPDQDSLTLTATLDDDSPLPEWLRFIERGASHGFVGTPPEDNSWEIKVTANDNRGGEVSDTFTLTAGSENSAPVVDQGIPDLTAVEGLTVSRMIPENAFMDADGDSLTFTATSLPDASAWLSVTGSTITAMPPAGARGEYEVTVTAADDSGATAEDTFTLTVRVGNRAPAEDQGMDDMSAPAGGEGSIQVPADAFADPDGDVLTYTFASEPDVSAWLRLTPAGLFRAMPPAGSSGLQAEVTVTAADGFGGTATTSFTLTVGGPPILSGMIGEQSATAGDAFSLDLSELTANDPDGDNAAVTVRVVRRDGSRLPSWLSYDADTMILAGTPAATDAGILALSVIAMDADGFDSEPLTFDLAVSAIAVISLSLSVGYVEDTDTIVARVTQSSSAATVGSVAYVLAVEAPTLTVARLGGESGSRLNLVRSVPTGTASGDSITTVILIDRDANPGLVAGNTVTVTLEHAPGREQAFTLSGSGSMTIEVPGVATGFRALYSALPELTAYAGLPFSFPLAANAFNPAGYAAPTYSLAMAEEGAVPEWLRLEGLTLAGTAPADAVTDEPLSLEVVATNPFGETAVTSLRLAVIAPATTSGMLAEADGGVTLTLPYVALPSAALDGPACVSFTLTAADADDLSSWQLGEIGFPSCGSLGELPVTPILDAGLGIHVPMAEWPRTGGERLCVAVSFLPQGDDARRYALAAMASVACPAAP